MTYIIEFKPTESRTIYNMILWLTKNIGQEGDKYVTDFVSTSHENLFSVEFTEQEDSIAFKLAWV